MDFSDLFRNLEMLEIFFETRLIEASDSKISQVGKLPEKLKGFLRDDFHQSNDSHLEHNESVCARW